MQRRDFLKQTGAAALTAAGTTSISGPFVRGSDKSGDRNAVIGQGAYRYECFHGWGKVPSSIRWHETLDGNPVSINRDVSFPAHFDIRGDILLLPDLHARVTLFGKDNNVLVHLGYDSEWTKQVLDGFKMRTQPARWPARRFIHPHDACFDKDGNIFVAEWMQPGRVSFLRHVS
jgi:hypothetical protein